MSDIVIQVENLSKKYLLKHQRRERYTALRDVLVERAQRLFYKSEDERLDSKLIEDFWALKDVSFDLKQGEVVGIIGRNGAGKSTLLKILSRITEPTTGRVRIRGRVASLLEVGTGFHPELTGRENIFLNGAILGMTSDEIKRKFDEIVSFAEVEQFLDTPVKRYSSGMYVRLAFSVAAHLEPEILIVDEVLAVGDVEFQKKCLGKMGAVSSQGRTVLFVSHNMTAIEALCSSTILLSKGRFLTKESTKKVVQLYLGESVAEIGNPLSERLDRAGSGVIRCLSVSTANLIGQGRTSLQCGDDALIVLQIENTTGRELNNMRLAIGIDSELGQRVLLLDTRLLGLDIEKVSTGVSMIRVLIPKLCLLPGRYIFTIYSTINGVIADWIKNAGFFDVVGGDYFGTGQLPELGQGFVVAEHSIEYVSSSDRENLHDDRKNLMAVN